MDLVESRLKKLPKGRHNDDQSGVQFDNRYAEAKWIKREQVNGKKTYTVIGTWPNMSLADARITMVTASTNPSDSMTVREFHDNHLQPRHLKDQKDTGVKYYWNHILEQIGEKPLNRVGLKELDLCMETTGSKSGPKHMHKQLSAAINKAIEWGILEINHANPCKYRKVKSLPARQTHVEHDQLPALVQAINEVDNPYIAGAITMTLLTGARANEILRLKWSDIHEDYIFIGLTKNKRPHQLPMFPSLAKVIAELRTIRQNDYLFPSHRSDIHLKSYRADWDRIREKLDFPDLTRHDIRRSVASLLINSGISLDAVSNVLNHKSQATTRAHYITYDATNRGAAIKAMDTIYLTARDNAATTQLSN